MMLRAVLLMLVLLSIWTQTHAFYVPGLSPDTYMNGDPIAIKYNKVFSDKTQLPFEYSKLPVCQPKEMRNFVENIGEVLRGDRISLSPFSIQMNEKLECKVLCEPIEITKKDNLILTYLIMNKYKVEWLIENLPSATTFIEDSQPPKKFYERGFDFGNALADQPLTINNHFDILILYHNNTEEYEGYRIVGFEVYPSSISSANRTGCTDQSKIGPQYINEGEKILYTYTITFQEDPNVTWANRWNFFLSVSDVGSSMHWYSIVNSIVLAFILSALVALMILRTLKNDIYFYNQPKMEEIDEDNGWKRVSGDVFRPPSNAFFLSVFVGSGIQFLAVAFLTMILAAVGILNPSYGGGMITVGFVIFILMGILAGYSSARLYKTFKGTSWRRNAVMTAVLFPSILFGVFFLLNLFIWSQNSSLAVPFGTFVVLVTLWFFISLPLVYTGAYLGQKQDPFSTPVVNPFPRETLPLPLYLQWGISEAFIGVIPFGVIYFELYYIMNSIWQDQYYYVFGFLLIISMILLVVCSEISFILIYLQLSNENYHWWWRSFFISASSTIYIFVYAISYFITSLEIISFIPALVYFTYVSLCCLIYFLCTGTIGFMICFLLLRKIYTEIKND